MRKNSPPCRDPSNEAPSDSSATVQEAADALWALVDSEAGAHGRCKVRACLKRFLTDYGTRSLASLRATDLIAFKAKIVRDGLVPNSANDVLTYTRRLLTFAYEIELVERPFRLGVLKNLRRGPVTTKAVSADNLKVLLRAVAEMRPNLARMMLLQFYGAMRASELPKLLYGRGDAVESGVFAILGKTSAKTGDLRLLLLSESALALLADTRPQYGDANCYRHQCWVVGRRLRKLKGDDFVKSLTGKPDLSPHFLRHTAATMLLQAGVPEEHWRAAMGRSRPSVDRVYAKKENWAEAQRSLEVLAVLVPPSIIR